MVRALISFVAVSLAVIVQLTIVDRIAFPGGSGPDVVLLAVAALALAGGPMTGVLIGFWGGLALDVAPPGSHFVGQNALVFCLIGYLCGLAADVPNSDGVPEQGRTAVVEIVITAIGAVLGEALSSLLGAMLSDPRVTWSAIRYVLPVAAVYDVLLCPFVLYGAAAVLRLAGAPRGERSRADWSMPAVRLSASAMQGAIRQVNGGSTPRLRLAERGRGEGLGAGRGPVPARREPRLKLGQGGSLGAGALGGTWGGLGGTSRALNSAQARAGLSTARFGRSQLGRSQLGRSLLGGSVFSQSPSALRSSTPARKSAPIGRSSFLGRSPFLGRSSALGRSPFLGRSSAPGRSASGYGPRPSRPGILARLTGGLRGTGRRQPRLRSQTAFRRSFGGRSALRGGSPGRGWLRRSSPRGLSGRRAPRLGAGPARLHMPRPRTKKRWRTGGYR